MRWIYHQEKKKFAFSLIAFLTVMLLTACGRTASGSSAQGTLPSTEELTIYGWEGYMPQSLLDAFTAEYGITVNYVGYGDSSEAIDAMRNGENYDLIVLSNLGVASSAQEGLLAELDYRNLPNFKNIGAAFRDLAFDPKNKHSIPFEWGTSGLLYRTDRVEQPVTAWADLWNPAYAGKVALWPYQRDMIGMALKVLGYSFNSEDPEELMQASARLMELKEMAFFMDGNLASGVPYLLDDDALVIYGWAYDMHEAEGHPVEYVLPEEGTFIWMDNLVIPAKSPRQRTAELFLDFLMRPESGAKIANEMYTAVPNEASHPLIEAEVLNNPLIFPKAEDLVNAEFAQPLSHETQARYDEIWTRFIADVSDQN